MLKEDIGLRIKRIRETMGFTKEKLANMLGVSGQYLGMVEHGKGCLSIGKIGKLCLIFLLTIFCLARITLYPLLYKKPWTNIAKTRLYQVVKLLKN